MKQDNGNNSSVMVIGCGFGQIPVIKAARELGCHVIGIDKNPQAIGSNLCDKFYDIDVLDYERALFLAEDLKVEAALTLQTDIAMPTVGYINSKMNLIGPSYEVAMDCSDKVRTREKLKNKNVKQPEFQIVKNYEEACLAVKKMGLPCVLKAPDASGSRGVHKINSNADILEAYKDAIGYSRNKTILIEQYIKGVEFGAQTFSINGIHKYIFIHDDVLSDPPYMIPVGHSFPSSLTQEQEEMAKKTIIEALDALDIKDGPSNIDFIIDENGKTQIIEIGCRMGATCLPELLFYYTGIDWVKNYVLLSLSKDIKNYDNKITNAVAAFVICSPKSGTYQSYSFNSSIPECNNLLELEITPKKGDVVSLLKKGTDRIGKIIAKGRTAEDAIRNCLQIQKQIELEIE